MSDAPNSISLAPYDRQDWIVRKPKHNRYKVVNFKRFDKRVKGVPRSGKTIFVYDGGTYLTIIKMAYHSHLNSGKAKFLSSDKTVFHFKIKDGHLVAWSLDTNNGNKIIRNASNRIFGAENGLLNFGQRNIYGGKFPKQNEADANVLPAPQKSPEDVDFDFDNITQRLTPHKFREWPEIKQSVKRDIKVIRGRLNKIVVHFLKRNGFKFKFSKNPFENLRVACYPNTAGFELKEQFLNPCYSRHFLHGDIKYVVKKTFGFDSSKLVRLVIERIQKDKSFDVLVLGTMLKGLVTVDHFHKMLEGNVNLEKVALFRKTNFYLQLKHYRGLFKRYNAARILKLVLSPDFGEHNFSDSVGMYAQLLEAVPPLPDKPRNWEEIHESLVPRRQNLYAMGTATEHFDLPVRDYMKAVDGAIFEDFTFEVPKDTKTLADYSAKMNNCIWSYGHQVKSGSCDLLGVYRNGELTYNISIVGQKLNQFSTKSNKPADSDVYNKVQDFLLQKGVLVPHTPNVIKASALDELL
jgi:hypothetical protein